MPPSAYDDINMGVASYIEKITSEFGWIAIL
jgi:hypothetical protein